MKNLTMGPRARGYYNAAGEFVPEVLEDVAVGAEIEILCEGEPGTETHSFLEFLPGLTAGTRIACGRCGAKLKVITVQQPATEEPVGAFIMLDHTDTGRACGEEPDVWISMALARVEPWEE